jgi:hypothetical protein
MPALRELEVLALRELEVPALRKLEVLALRELEVLFYSLIYIIPLKKFLPSLYDYYCIVGIWKCKFSFN